MSPVAVANTPTPTVESLKVTAAAPQVDLLAFAHFDSTPAIGTEFEAVCTEGKPVLSIQDVLADPARVAALSRLVSERGVVFFRNGEITPTQQQQLVIGLSRAGGAPADSTLHIHPLTFEGSALGDQITWISNENRDIYYGDADPQQPRILQRVAGKTLWVSFTPADACLRKAQRRDL